MMRPRADHGFRGRVWTLMSVLAAGVALGGCSGKGRPLPPYTGPTEPMSAVVAKINANNSRLPTLYARCYIEADIVHKGKSRFVNTEGDLFVRKPNELLLRGRKVLEKVFEMGSTADRYWLSIYLDENTRWWGYHRNAGKAGTDTISVRPDLVGEVLGTGQVNTDFNALPAPTMTFNNDLRVYMIAWHAKKADRWVTEKEIWYDLGTCLPRKVLLFDENGRVILRANLSEHQAADASPLPRDQWPVMATMYDLYFPETGSDMTMKLSDMVLRNEGGHPREGTIVFREASELKEIQIDEQVAE